MEANVLLERHARVFFPVVERLSFSSSADQKSRLIRRGTPDPRLLAQQLVGNLAVLTAVPESRRPRVSLHAITALSTVSHQHVRRHIEAHTMMHYSNEKRHVRGPEAPLHQRVGGNSSDPLKTFDVPTVFGC